MPDKIRMRRGNLVNLPTLDDGEIGLAEDSKTVYIGSTAGNVKFAMATLEAIIAPTLLNSWVNNTVGFQTAGYYKDNFGIVHLTGLIKSGTTTVGTNLFILPVGYRPTGALSFPTYSNDGATIGTLQILSGGNVNIVTGSNVSFSLDGVSFRTT